LKNSLLAPFTSWQIGGPAEEISQPTSVEQLKHIISETKLAHRPIHVLGGGSNVLINDSGLSGLTIVMDKLSSVQTSTTSLEWAGPYGSEAYHPECRAETRLFITAETGAGKNLLLKNFLKHKLAPALFLAGIPGTVGGGIVMNAGVAESFAPREFCGITDWIEVLKPDLTIQKYKTTELQWSYRHCHGWEPGIIVRAGLSWPLIADTSILEKTKNANQVRLTKQPLDWPSCGSVFVNPVGHKAAQLIDGCGLKGYRIGGAQVSTKHANFIINAGGSTAQDMAEVIEHVRSTVKKQTGVDLKTEVVFMGFD
jgi:UDP-N-acetylmuramate dehydrogenase